MWNIPLQFWWFPPLPHPSTPTCWPLDSSGWMLAGLVVPPTDSRLRTTKNWFFFFSFPADFLVWHGCVTFWACSVASASLGFDPFAFSHPDWTTSSCTSSKGSSCVFLPRGRWSFDFVEEQQQLGGLVSCVYSMKPGDWIISELWIIQSQTAFYFIFKL